MSEYLYFIFQIHNPNLKLIREFKNVIQTDERSLKQQLHKLNIPFSNDRKFTIEKMRVFNNKIFDFVFIPVTKSDPFKTHFEARRMVLDCS